MGHRHHKKSTPFPSMGRRRDKGYMDFWPAVTDIVSVILMLFVITMVILVSHNSGLAQKNSSLEDSAIGYQERVIALSQELEASDENAAMAEAKLKDLTLVHQKMLEDLAEANREKGDLALNIKTLEADKKKLGADFAALDSKYQKLIRPARSPKGKKVVEVSYHRTTYGRGIWLKLPGERTAKIVSEVAMHRQIGKLHRKFPKKLYIKIVFPKGSEVTHQEAWRFTHRLLRDYDYYYQ